MKPKFPFLKEAIHLTRKFFDFGLMRKFAELMDGNRIINEGGLPELNEKYKGALDAIDKAEEEALRISQQANDLTQQFYFEDLKDFKGIVSFAEYSPTYIDEMLNVYNSHHTKNKIDREALVIYKMYTDGAVNGLNRVCNFYYLYYEKKFGRNPSVIISSQKELLKETSTKGKPKKIATELNANQLLYLFKTLKECGIFHRGVKQNALCRLIANNFSSTNYEELSSDSLEKKWKLIDVNDIAFWNDKFPELYNKSIKDNPLKIKYKKKIGNDL